MMVLVTYLIHKTRTICTHCTLLSLLSIAKVIVLKVKTLPSLIYATAQSMPKAVTIHVYYTTNVAPLDMWQMNITDIANDTDIQFTNLCIRSRDPKSRIPCSDINGIPVLKESIFGGTSCAESHKTNETIPCKPCWIQAKALMLTYLLNNDDYTKENA
jgi:hypothetical protein